MNIGFFDSGLGGLLLLRETVKQLPDYNYVYFGDTKHLPYGDKSEEEIYELTKSAITELFERDCSLVIVACNTASAEALRKLQDTFVQNEFPEKKVLGVIIPTIEELITSNAKRAILLATVRTVNSGKYSAELRKQKEVTLSLEEVAMRELVPLIEQGQLEKAVAITVSKLQELTVGKGDVVILGCTHYVLLKEQLRAKFPEVNFLSQDEFLPEKIKTYLDRHPELKENLSKDGERTIHLTEHRADYDALLAQFLRGAFVGEE